MHVENALLNPEDHSPILNPKATIRSALEPLHVRLERFRIGGQLLDLLPDHLSFARPAQRALS